MEKSFCSTCDHGTPESLVQKKTVLGKFSGKDGAMNLAYNYGLKLLYEGRHKEAFQLLASVWCEASDAARLHSYSLSKRNMAYWFWLARSRLRLNRARAHISSLLECYRKEDGCEDVMSILYSMSPKELETVSYVHRRAGRKKDAKTIAETGLEKIKINQERKAEEESQENIVTYGLLVGGLAECEDGDIGELEKHLSPPERTDPYFNLKEYRRAKALFRFQVAQKLQL